jgi:hypothetical protein
MIRRFTMRQALSAPDLLGNALVTLPFSQGTARMMSSGLIIVARSRSRRRRTGILPLRPQS